MSETLLVVVDPGGGIRFLWNDALAGLAAQGRTAIRRASHVEPTPDGRWTADLSPSSGPLLGPFELRGEALGAERRWLEERMGSELGSAQPGRRGNGGGDG